MSLQVLKKKNIILHGQGNVSGEGPPGFWMEKQPYFSTSGFSINGAYRDGKYIGKSSAFSKNSTPYYKSVALNATYDSTVLISGSPNPMRSIQHHYVKATTLNTMAYLRRKLLNTPHWVQNTYPTGTQDANASHSSYLQTIKCFNGCKSTGVSSSSYQEEKIIPCLKNNDSSFPFHMINGAARSCKRCPKIDVFYSSMPDWKKK
jgi:hypothetical protein